MQDLVECLFTEGFFLNTDQKLLSLEQLQISCEKYPGLFNQLTRWPDAGSPQQSTLFWCCWSGEPPHSFIVIPVRKNIALTLQRIPSTPVYAVNFDDTQTAFEVLSLTPVSLMQRVQKLLPDDTPGQTKGCELFLESLKTTLQQTAWSLEHQINTDGLFTRPAAETFQVLEQWSSIRDRPFHPIAKAKMGLNETEYRQYLAEFGEHIPLHWVAVARDSLCFGNGVESPQQIHPAQFLLSREQQASLQEEMQRRGIDQTHVAIPVHPWQLEHVLPEQIGEAWQTGILETLSFSEAKVLATSSVRTMAPLTNSPHYLKLPMAIYSLGASRYLPGAKMINGQRSEQLMKQALPLDPLLPDRVFLCDETKWWGFMPEGKGLFDEGPRHLAALIRTYPQQLLEDSTYRMVPMAAMGTLLNSQTGPSPENPKGLEHFFDQWMEHRQLAESPESVEILFRELCQCFLDIKLRMFRIGMLAEMHGQNVVLVLKDGQPEGLLFRDHDSLRIYVPWLEENGLADPEYCIRKGTPNTLYHDAPEDLLFYLLTLGIQVNLRAIIETLAIRFSMDDARLWLVIREELEQVIQTVDFSDDVRAMINQQLFENSEWPLKLLVKPLIERAGGPGSMPFGKGTLQNPFHNLKTDLA
ncbi:hypothetical protein BTA51_11685 [Hahella sp. CCB-MM4]|nr:hypothetical protein BTA51_11685 [Hahella sp. CCB-MM4]